MTAWSARRRRENAPVTNATSPPTEQPAEVDINMAFFGTTVPTDAPPSYETIRDGFYGANNDASMDEDMSLYEEPAANEAGLLSWSNQQFQAPQWQAPVQPLPSSQNPIPTQVAVASRDTRPTSATHPTPVPADEALEVLRNPVTSLVPTTAATSALRARKLRRAETFRRFHALMNTAEHGTQCGTEGPPSPERGRKRFILDVAGDEEDGANKRRRME